MGCAARPQPRPCSPGPRAAHAASRVHQRQTLGCFSAPVGAAEREPASGARGGCGWACESHAEGCGPHHSGVRRGRKRRRWRPTRGRGAWRRWRHLPTRAIRVLPLRGGRALHGCCRRARRGRLTRAGPPHRLHTPPPPRRAHWRARTSSRARWPPRCHSPRFAAAPSAPCGALATAAAACAAGTGGALALRPPLRLTTAPPPPPSSMLAPHAQPGRCDWLVPGHTASAAALPGAAGMPGGGAAGSRPAELARA
jgi:hypothetical protein